MTEFAKFYAKEMEIYAGFYAKKKSNLEKHLKNKEVLEYFNFLNNINDKESLLKFVRDVYFCFGEKNWLYVYMLNRLFKLKGF